MKEVRDLATAVQTAVANLKATNQSVLTNFNAEVQRANVNADKIRSFTLDLKNANAEVEASLGDTGSNFPPSSTATSEASTVRATTDRNGVTINTGSS